MQVVNNRYEEKKSKFTVQQMGFMVIKGFGHLAVMAGLIFIMTSFLYTLVGSFNIVDFATGILIIAAGHQLQKLGDKLDERHVLNTKYLDTDIKQLTTRFLTISVIVIAILL